MERHMIPFLTITQRDRDLIDLAFNLYKEANRCEWARCHKPEVRYFAHQVDEVSFSDFINGNLILFSVAGYRRLTG